MLFMSMRCIIPLFALPSLLFAQPPRDAPLPPPSPWTAGLMAGWDSQPYREARGEAVAFPFLSYRGERLQWLGPQLLYAFYLEGPWTVSGHATLQFPAYEEDDAEILRGLGDRSYTLLSGFHLRYELNRRWELASRLNVESLGAHDGVQWTQSLKRNVGSPRGPFPLFGSVALELVAQDANWTDDFVGVPADKSRPGRPAYSPGATAFPAIGLTAVYRLNSTWSLFATSRFDFLPSEWSNSPLIEKDHRFQILTALQYSF